MPRAIVTEFENHLQKFFGNRCDVIATNSGTSALIATLWSMNLKPDDEVITTPFTFPSTANAILIAGAKAVFVDVTDDCLIDVGKIKDAITPKTKAIIPVHLFGRICNMVAINHLAKQNDLMVIEDAAQAFGSEAVLVPGGPSKAGTLGHVGCFSFYATKSFNTLEGGCIVVNDTMGWCLGDAIRSIVNCGLAIDGPRYQLDHIGFNFRMNPLAAMVGLNQIKLHDAANTAELGRFGLRHGYYPRCVFDQPAYRRCPDRWRNEGCPNAESLAKLVRHGEL